MSLEHVLNISTKLSPEQVLSLLIAGDTFSSFAERLSEREARVWSNGFGFFIYTGLVLQYNRELFRKELSIEPDVSVIFRVAGSKDAEATSQKLLGAVLELLRQESGDAVLLLTGEIVCLLRRDGQLLLGKRDTFWIPENIKLIGAPYTVVNDFPLM